MLIVNSPIQACEVHSWSSMTWKYAANKSSKLSSYHAQRPPALLGRAPSYMNAISTLTHKKSAKCPARYCRCYPGRATSILHQYDSFQIERNSLNPCHSRKLEQKCLAALIFVPCTRIPSSLPSRRYRAYTVQKRLAAAIRTPA